MRRAHLPSRLMWAALMSAAAVGPLALFASACGNIHQSTCGVASPFAVALVVPSLILFSLVLGP